LVKHGVKSDGSLSGLTITDDQLTLTTTDRNHGIDRFETCLDRLVDGLSGKDTRGFDFSSSPLLRLDWSLAIDGVTEGINDTSEQFRSDWDVDNLSGTLDGLSLLDETIRTEQHNTDLASFQVQAHSLDTGGELNELFGLDIL